MAEVSHGIIFAQRERWSPQLKCCAQGAQWELSRNSAAAQWARVSRGSKTASEPQLGPGSARSVLATHWRRT